MDPDQVVSNIPSQSQINWGTTLTLEEWAIAGAHSGMSDAYGAGYATVFRRLPSGEWTLETLLNPIEDLDGEINFGRSLFLDGGILAIGAPYTNLENGYESRLFIYELEGEEWVQQASFTPDEDFENTANKTVYNYMTNVQAHEGRVCGQSPQCRERQSPPPVRVRKGGGSGSAWTTADRLPETEYWSFAHDYH